MEKFIRELHRLATCVKITKHIECLVMGLFLRYLPFVIEQGKLYVANPPLYGVQIGKQTKFFADNLEYTEYVQQSFTKDNKVAHISGKEITKKELTKILYNNADGLASTEI